MTHQTRKLLVIWLGLCSVMVFSMVLLGGSVRLTGSGLSMVDWKPLMGVIPPLSEQAWNEMFLKYQQFPEYKVKNSHMDLAQFKFIFLMEYSHRILGRLIGVVFLLPFLGFIFRGKLDSGLTARLWLLFALGAVQGVVGWYMVKSGLVDNPRVSQYRLVLHLLIAVFIYAYMIRILAGLMPTLDTPSHPPCTRILGWILLCVVLIMIASGGFVAGTHAGHIYNTFPKMGQTWIPDQLFALAPAWRNFFENPVAIQFFHRCMAVVVLGLVLLYWKRLSGDTNKVVNVLGWLLLVAVAIQLSLGIATLLTGVLPVLGVAHQAGALLLLTVVVIAVFSDSPRFSVS